MSTLDLFPGLAPAVAPPPARPPAACDLLYPEAGRVLRGEVNFALYVTHYLDFLRSLPDESIDLVDTDVPYSSLELHRSKGTTTRLKASDGSSNEWFGTIPDSSLPELLAEFYRVLRPDRHCYLWVDEPTMDVIKAQQFARNPDGTYVRNKSGWYPCASGFKYHRHLTWVKTTKAGDAPRGGMGYHWRGAKELILFLEKGKRRLNDLGLTDVLLHPRPDVDHGTPKPRETNEAIVINSSNLGEVVLDPFCGSGSAPAAAVKLGRRALGCDIDPKAIVTSRAEIAAATAIANADV